MKKKLAGLLAALMVLSMSTTVFAATSPTACLFVPATVIFVLASTESVIPAGGTIRTG